MGFSPKKSATKGSASDLRGPSVSRAATAFKGGQTP